MDLVDRYARAVAKALPEEQREDIIGELSEDIRSEMEDKQSELGRPLTEQEVDALLRQRGNPLLLAARYRQDHRSVAFGRQIVGPVLYPFYIKVLSFNLGLTFLVIAIIFIALAVSGQKLEFNYIVLTCLVQLFIQWGIVTLIFSMVEQHLKKHPDRWHFKGKDGGLALDFKIEKDVKTRIRREAKGGLVEVSRFESISIIVASAVALVWVTSVQSHPFLILGPAAAFLKLAPIWHTVFFPIVVLTVAEIVRAIINLARPDWTGFRVIARILEHAGGLAVVCFLFRAGTWVATADAMAGRAKEFARAVEIVNQSFYFGLLATVILSAGMLIFRIVEPIQKWRHQDCSRGSGATAKAGN